VETRRRPFHVALERGEGLPRVHPINLEIVLGHLLAFLIEGSAKVTGLASDGRYALSSLLDLMEAHEFLVRGRVSEPASGCSWGRG